MSYSYSLSLPPPSSLATIKLANPGSPGKWPLNGECWQQLSVKCIIVTYCRREEV